MAIKKVKLTKTDLDQMNNDLRELQGLQDEIAKAHEAGLPNIDEDLQRCVECQESIKRLKAVYFPGKP